MKTIAFYLPQFHSIPENDEWWGRGFTEWTNVKKSQPQFEGHVQPEVPYDNEYYDLLDESVQVHQAKLAQEYGLYGFCYYHYWFDGKKLLEKPMENMLSNSRIDIPFCVCWANETWSRTWDGHDTDVLIKQNYEENKNGWKQHFEYLLPFFQDDRYIKVDNKPMFIMYKPQLCDKIGAMVECWNELAIQHGFDGIFWGYQHNVSFDYNVEKDGFHFGIEFEPMYTRSEMERNKKSFKLILRTIILKTPGLSYLFKKTTEYRYKKTHKSGLCVFDYDEVWNHIISRMPKKEVVMPGAFTAWDNTPRRGDCATIFKGANPQKFEKYLTAQIERAKNVYHSDFLFINAWNEWGEGAHLEPDMHFGKGYLEALKNALENAK